MNTFDFDKGFKRTQKLAICAFIVNSVLSLSLLGGLIWVAWHFISKFW